MKNTADFLDALRVKLELSSDGKLADYLGKHRQYVSLYRKNECTFDDEMSLKVADLLEIDPVFVVACMHHQRAKQAKEKAIWTRIATMASGAGVGLFVLLAVPFVTQPPMDASIVTNQADSGALYIMLNTVSDYWQVFVVLTIALLVTFPWHHPHPKKEAVKLSKR